MFHIELRFLKGQGTDRTISLTRYYHANRYRFLTGWEDLEEKVFEGWKIKNKCNVSHGSVPLYREFDDYHFRFLFGCITIVFEAAPHLQRGFNVYT